jgi:periplasmic divalent cation tolerance protein
VSPSRFASDPGVRVVLVTAPEPDTAARLARTLVEERLAACVNLVPQVRSIYRWQDQVEDGSETLMVIKTRAERCEALASRVGELHPYDVPEVVELSVAGGSEEYFKWVREESAP